MATRTIGGTGPVDVIAIVYGSAGSAFAEVRIDYRSRRTQINLSMSEARALADLLLDAVTRLDEQITPTALIGG
jgi:hypothetical protein